MTESEAIKICNTIGFATSFSNPQGVPLNTTKEELTEAIRMSIQALKKQIAKKPINNKHAVSVSSTAVKVVDWWKCGKCNGDLTRQFACCPYCQTVIDWSDEE